MRTSPPILVNFDTPWIETLAEIFPMGSGVHCVPTYNQISHGRGRGVTAGHFALASPKRCPLVEPDELLLRGRCILVRGHVILGGILPRNVREGDGADVAARAGVGETGVFPRHAFPSPSIVRPAHGDVKSFGSIGGVEDGE